MKTVQLFNLIFNYYDNFCLIYEWDQVQPNRWEGLQ
jgi:hypothetical protein